MRQAFMKPKRVLWAAWGITTVITAASTILLLITFANLAAVKGEPPVPSSQLNAALSGTLLSAIILILLDIVAFFTFLRRTTWGRRSPGGGFSFPFIASSYLHSSLFVLLTGIILTSNLHWLDQFEQGTTIWTSGDTSAYRATYILSFISTGACITTFIAVALLHRPLQQQAATAPSGSEVDMSSGLAVTGSPMSHEEGFAVSEAPTVGSVTSGRTTYAGAPGSANRVGRDSTIPSDYYDSVAAGQRHAGTGGAWKM